MKAKDREHYSTLVTLCPRLQEFGSMIRTVRLNDVFSGQAFDIGVELEAALKQFYSGETGVIASLGEILVAAWGSHVWHVRDGFDAKEIALIRVALGFEARGTKPAPGNDDPEFLAELEARNKEWSRVSEARIPDEGTRTIIGLVESCLVGLRRLATQDENARVCLLSVSRVVSAHDQSTEKLSRQTARDIGEDLVNAAVALEAKLTSRARKRGSAKGTKTARPGASAPLAGAGVRRTGGNSPKAIPPDVVGVFERTPRPSRGDFADVLLGSDYAESRTEEWTRIRLLKWWRTLRERADQGLDLETGLHPDELT